VLKLEGDFKVSVYTEVNKENKREIIWFAVASE
jgi:hypothetical protein